MSVPAAFPANDPHNTMRASDADRDHVAEALREAYAEGRLDVEEHNERIDLAYKAKTLGELSPLLSDLPQRHAATLAGPTSPIPPMPADYAPGSKITAVFAEQKRGGRWVVPSTTTAAAVFGSVTIDLREAVLTQREVVIIANAVFGSIEIKVPHGVVVRDEGTAVFGSRSGSDRNAAGDVPITPDSPVVVLRGMALFGEVSVRYPKPKKLGKFLGR
ncbi:DUF1707 SHOCT-like domain-containing protein [Catenulispora rubra]|uniref:DUF1707 SHOCT-like domain-containing protein n=1 Tax=Catenulispora rubra TaxID=280293 RepID=UPI002B275043|nr:DUF1707 domain-containing protein [Catenulispora rubra]